MTFVEEDEVEELMTEFANGMEKATPALASYLRTYFEELVEQGFTEEQALEIVIHSDNSVNATK